MLLEEFDHHAVEQPWLLHVAGMAGARQHSEFRAPNTGLEIVSAFVNRILASGEDKHRARDPGVEVFRFRSPERLELQDDRVDVGEIVSLGEYLGKIVR